MRRMPVLLLLTALWLLIGIGPAAAKKKPSKPVIETFEATAPGGEVMRFEIEEYSTDQDVQELAQAYTKNGKDAVESKLGKIERGRSFVRQTSYPIRLVQSASQGGTRSVFIIGDAADRVAGETGGQVFIGHRGYPFTVAQLQMDQQGKGIGQLVPFAAITFNKQGVMEIKSMGGAAIRLSNVHAVSQ